jgi:hypothetical protein
VFLHLKTFLGDLRFHEHNKVNEDINTWFALQAATFYDAGIQKLVPRYQKCPNGGNYGMSKNSIKYVHQMTI